MRDGLQYGFAFEEALLLGEGVEHLGGGKVGGGIANLVAARVDHLHYFYFYN